MSESSRRQGKFITFEGIDGAGKSTTLKGRRTDSRARLHGGFNARAWWAAAGELRELLLHEPMHLETEAMLMFAASRASGGGHRTGRKRGDWVICDRFSDATYAYQGGGPAWTSGSLKRWNNGYTAILQPDLTFLFDSHPEVAGQRIGARARTRSI